MNCDLHTKTTRREKPNRFHKGFHIFICFASVALVLLLAREWWHLHLHHEQICDKLDRIDPESLLIRGNDDASLRNSDLYLRFSHTDLSKISILVAGMGVALTFFAFFIQYLFNKRQKEDLTDERFENHLFHFLNSYREICNDTEIPHAGRGKTAFHFMFYEYKAVYNLLLQQGIASSDSPRELNAIAFTLFLDGVSSQFEPVVPVGTANKAKLTALWRKLLDLQEASETNTAKNRSDKGVVYLADYRGRNIKYFDGHRPRLIPYFKYLFLIFDYLIDENLPLEAGMRKLSYLSSQMSEHEIGLLYAYMHCYGTKASYRPYLDAIYAQLAATNADRFLFDSGNFIKQPVVKK